MAENIQKCYRNGDWGQDSNRQRYDHVIFWLEMYQQSLAGSKQIDYNDLKWFIKNAMIRRVYLSRAVKRLGEAAWLPTRDSFLADRLAEINQQGYTDNINAVELRRWKGKGLVFEHVVPAEVYINDMITCYMQGKLSFDMFEQMRDKLHICVITTEEDRQLNAAHVKKSMPSNSDWLKGDEWARYKEAQIAICTKQAN